MLFRKKPEKAEERVELQFFGGPLDGYEQPLLGPPARILAFPVSRNVLAALLGLEGPSSSPITSVAFYEATHEAFGGEETKDTYACRYLGSTSPDRAAKVTQSLRPETLDGTSD